MKFQECLIFTPNKKAPIIQSGLLKFMY